MNEEFGGDGSELIPCPYCDEDLELFDLELEDTIQCIWCNAELVVSGENPPSLSIVEDGYVDYDEEDEE